MKKIAPLLLLLIAMLSAAPARAAAQETSASTAAVTLGGRTVLIVSGRELSLTPQERAQRASERLLALSRDPMAGGPDAIKVSEGEDSSDVVAGGTVLMSVTDRDARRAGLDRRELAARDADLMREAMSSYRRDHGARSLLLDALLALFSTAVFILLLKLLASAHAASAGRMEAWVKGNIRPLRVQQVELLNARHVLRALGAFFSTVRLLLTLLLVYFYVPTLLSFFPWTRGLSPVLFGYVLHPVYALIKAFFGYLPNLIFVAVIVTLVHYLLKLLHVVAEDVHQGRLTLGGFYPDWAKPTFQIARLAVWALTLVIVFPYLPGSGSPAFKGVSVFLGVLLSLGSSSAVSNAVAGVMLTYMRPFSVGDRVRIGDNIAGDVLERTLLVTRIRTIKHVVVTMPNSLVLANHIMNLSAHAKEEGLILNTSVTIGYDVPWPKVHQLLISAAESTERVLKEPKPFVLQRALNDYNVQYELNAYVGDPHGSSRVYSNLHAAIQDKFNAAGVEIMSPAYAALRDGNAPARPGADPGGRAFRVQAPPGPAAGRSSSLP